MTPRKAYIDMMKDQHNDWQVEIDSFKARSESIEDHKREAYQKKIASLEDQKRQAEEKLAELRSADESSWEAFKRGYESLRADIARSIRDAQTDY